MRSGDYFKVVNKFLQGRWYRETAEPSEDVASGQTRGYFALCRRVGGFEQSHIVSRSLIQSVRVDCRTLVSFRNVHVCRYWSSEGFARWLDKTITERLAVVAPH